MLCYTGRVSVELDDAIGLLRVLDALGNVETKSTCQQILIRTLTLENCVSLLLVGMECRAEALMQQAKVYCRKHFYKLEEAAFEAAPPAVLVDLLNSDDVVVDTELTLLQGIEGWVSAYTQGPRTSVDDEDDPEGEDSARSRAGVGRDCSPEEILAVVQTVRLAGIDPLELKSALVQMPTLSTTAECVELIEEVLAYHSGGKTAAAAAELGKRIKMYDRDTKRSDWIAMRIYGLAEADGEWAAHVVDFDPVRHRWSLHSSVLCDADETVRVGKVGGEVFGIKGRTAEQEVVSTAFASANRFDPAQGRWSGPFCCCCFWFSAQNFARGWHRTAHVCCPP
jgi:hypothetical protein